MKRYKVLKEFGELQAGEIVESDTNFIFSHPSKDVPTLSVSTLIYLGYLTELPEEKGLEGKIHEILNGSVIEVDDLKNMTALNSIKYILDKKVKAIAQLATEHFFKDKIEPLAEYLKKQDFNNLCFNPLKTIAKLAIDFLKGKDS